MTPVKRPRVAEPTHETNHEPNSNRDPEEAKAKALKESYARLVRNSAYRAQPLLALIVADFTCEPPSSSDAAMALGLDFYFPNRVRIDLHTRALTGMSDSTLREFARFLPKAAEAIALCTVTPVRAVALHYSARATGASASGASAHGVHVFYDAHTPPNAVFLDMHRWGHASKKPLELAAHIALNAPAHHAPSPPAEEHAPESPADHERPSKRGCRALTL